MASEVIKLNLIPSGEMPTYHCSQFDNGREIKIELYNGEDAYTLPTGYTAELHTRKMDNNIVTLSSTSVVSNLVTFTSTEQLTACAGNNLSEVSIKDASDYVVGTLNFWLYVEKDPLCGGLTSTSSIHDLTDQIEEITTEIVGENYYNKSETDDLLDLKADKSTTYTKTETDTLLTAKADKTSVYTKSETDDLLDAKADANTVYAKTQVYNKTETDALLAAKADSADLATVATTGDYNDLINKPTIPAAQIQSDYAQADNTKVDYIKNKPDIDAMIADALLAVMPVDSAGPSAIANFNTELAVDLVDFKTTLTPSLDGYSAVNIQRCDNACVPLWSIDNTFRGTVVFNQLIQYDTNRTQGNLTVTTDASTKKVSINLSDDGGSNSYTLLNDNVNIKVKLNHKYLVSLNNYKENNAVICIRTVGTWKTGTTVFDALRDYSTLKTATILNAGYDGGDLNLMIDCRNPFTIPTAYPATAEFYPQIIDLTQMFGSTIADYIYSLEQNESGAGVAFFRSMYPNEYYNYNTGTTELIGTNLASIALGDTYYGGTLDVTTGVLTVEYDSSLQPITPYDVQLTPTVVHALAGVNNVYSDTGDTSVKYKDSIQHYIDTH